MIHRCFTHEEVTPSVAPFASDYAEGWLEDDHNVALSDGNGNVSLFTFERPGVYSGHYYYLNARGQEAFKIAKEAVYRIFNYYDAKLLFGLVPKGHKGSTNLTKRLGFQSHGDVEGYGMEMELFILTKKDYENGWN